MTTDDTSLQFVCPQCIAMLKAPMALAGSRCRCPRCQFVFQAPHESRRPFSGETYAIQSDAAPSSAAPDVEIAVTCSLCNARMSATPDQIGQTLTCPDCGRPAIVPRPTTPFKPTVPPIILQPYALQGETSPTSNASEDDNESLTRVFCPRCGTMMYAAEDQAGRSLICPDCHTSVVVPPPRPHRKRIDVMAEAGGGYSIVGQNEARSSDPAPPPVILPPNAPPPRVQAVRARAQRQFEPYFRHPILPRAPFFAGTYTFPLSSGVLGITLLIAISAMAAFSAAVWAIDLAAVGSFPTLFASAMLTAATTIITLLLVAFASASGLAVVRDTAAGCDRIHNWPGMAFIDWFGEPFYVLNSLCASLVPGLGIAWILNQYDQSFDAAIPISLFFFFPVVLLSTLETVSVFGIVSWPVCRTFWQAWLGWGTFYLSTAALLVVAAILSAEAFLAAGPSGIFGAAPILTAAWLIYCRMLGRLAWYCTDRARKRAEALEAAENPDPDG
jgi:DNA-directed RNA polymerase subunit M/transcription elongation factor TFIIS